MKQRKADLPRKIRTKYNCHNTYSFLVALKAPFEARCPRISELTRGNWSGPAREFRDAFRAGGEAPIMMENDNDGNWFDWGLGRGAPIDWYVRVIGMVHTRVNSGLMNQLGDEGECICSVIRFGTSKFLTW